jgi:maltose O-acetyltransferase
MPGVIISLHENAQLILSEKSWIGPGTIIYTSQKISIGKNVRIAHYCSIVDHDYFVNSSDKFGKRISSPISISDEVWLGASCIILKGVNIGTNSVIAAATTITKNINANCIVYKKNDLIIKDIELNNEV